MSSLVVTSGRCDTVSADVLVVGWNQDVAPPASVVDVAGQPQHAAIAWRRTLAAQGDRLAVGRLRVSNLAPGSSYVVRVGEPSTPETTARIRTLPTVLPDEGLTFLLGSCYFREGDKGRLWDAFQEVLPADRPAFKLLVGDQIYGDVGTALTFSEHPYREKYEQHWREPGYRSFLAATPNFFTFDDHEFWNNAPEFQLQIFWTWTASSRKARHAEAIEALEAYQTERNAQGGFWQIVSVPPASVFLADTRTERQPHGQTPRVLVSDNQRRAMAEWANGLQGPGFLVLGQPLFSDAGDGRDFNLPSYEDHYREIWDLLELSTHDIVVLTGDIHVGRLATSSNLATPSRVIHEITASPHSLVVLGGTPNPQGPGTVTTEGGLPRGATREVVTKWGTSDSNFSLIKLVPVPNTTRVRLECRVWSIDKKAVARNALGQGECVFEVLLA